MPKRAMSLIAAVVALGGFSFAVFLPAASAQKSNGVYTQYCEYTQYSQYGEYCEPATTTTVNNGTTTVITSPGFTITGLPGAPGSTVTPPVTGTLVVGKGGVVSIKVADLKPGESFSANGVAVKVLAFTANGVEMSFGGVDVDVPSTAAVAISKDGTVTVTYFIAGGKLIPALRETGAAAFRPVAAVGQQDVILPGSLKSSTFSYVLPKGVSFGAKTTWAEIGKDFTVEATGTSALRAANTAAKLSKVALKVAANKARSAVTVKLAKPERSYIIKLNVAKLVYSAAEQKYLTKHKVKTLSPTFEVVATKGKTTTKATIPFTYPVS